MSAATQSELDAILRTLREVEINLERRYARAEGTLLMIWGLVGASIFAFYQLVTLDHDRYHAALGPALNWAWILPMSLGYVASAILGARLGRIGPHPERQRRLRRGAIPGILIAILVTTLIITQRYHYIFGGVVTIAGIALVALAHPRSPTRTLSTTLGATMTALGLTLLALGDAPWVPGAAALAFLATYLTLGTVKYRAGG